MCNEILMAYSRRTIANICMLSKSDWRIGPATLPHTYTHSAHDTVSSQLMHCYIGDRSLLLHILYASKKFTLALCVQKKYRDRLEWRARLLANQS